MEDQKMNAIEIKESIDLHLKIGIGYLIEFKLYFIFDCQENKWKRLQWNVGWKPIIKMC